MVRNSEVLCYTVFQIIQIHGVCSAAMHWEEPLKKFDTSSAGSLLHAFFYCDAAIVVQKAMRNNIYSLFITMCQMIYIDELIELMS